VDPLELAAHRSGRSLKAAISIIATLENRFTPAERRLAEMGQVDRVRDMRT
jgi:hypothetical protein